MNLFRIMQSIRGWAQAGKIDFPGAVKYLTDLGVKMDGIVHQALKNVFKEGKARDPDFGNVVEKLQIDEQGIPFNPNTLKSTTEKRGVENLFKDKSISEKMSDIKTTSSKLDDAMKEYENIYKPKSLADELAAGEGVETFETILPTKKVPKEVKFGKPDYERIARMEGIDVEEIRGKTVKEIIEYLAMLQKKDGGRIGFGIGGLSDRAQAIYDSWIAAGHTETDVLEYLTSQGLYGDQEAEGIETIVNTAPAVGGGGGDGDFKGGGKWGNLDLSKTKTFNKGVYELGGPGNMYGSFVDKDITGYYDPKQGNWKTFEGKNIEHGGYFTGEPKEGDIEGTPIDWSGIPMGAFGLGMKAFKGIQDYWTGQKEKSAIRKENKLQEEIRAANLLAAQQAQQSKAVSAADLANIQQIQDYTGQALSQYRMDRPASERQFTGHGKSGMGRDPGGLATMFTRRR